MFQLVYYRLNKFVRRLTGSVFQKSGQWPYQTVRPNGFERQEGSALRTCDVWKSREPLALRAATALTVSGQRLQWQPVYGLTRAGQYGVDEEGYVYVASERGKEPDPQQMILYVFE